MGGGSKGGGVYFVYSEPHWGRLAMARPGSPEGQRRPLNPLRKGGVQLDVPAQVTARGGDKPLARAVAVPLENVLVCCSSVISSACRPHPRP